MLIRDVMQPDPVTVPASASLRDTIRHMLLQEVGYVIVVDSDDNPGGVVTESDLLHAVYQADPPPADIGVVDVAHAPDFTIKPTLPVRKAVRRMTSRDQTVVPVMDGLDLVGIVSLSRIVGDPSITVHERGVEERDTERW